MAAYIGGMVVAGGTFLALAQFFGKYRQLPDKQQDGANALGIGLIGFGGAITLIPTVFDFSERHHWLAIGGLLLVVLAALSAFLVPCFLSARVLNSAQSESGEHESHSEDRVRDDKPVPRSSAESS